MGLVIKCKYHGFTFPLLQGWAINFLKGPHENFRQFMRARLPDEGGCSIPVLLSQKGSHNPTKEE